MRIFLNILAAILILAGVVWFLQGIGILPGSMMAGQMKWAVNGGISFIVGIGVLLFANLRKASSPKK